MPRRKLTEAEKIEKDKKLVYQKLINNELVSIKDLAKLLQKRSCTIRKWEEKGIVQKPAKIDPIRMYTYDELAKFLHDLINHEWKYKTIDMDEIKCILKYWASLVEVNHVKRRVIKKDPYSFDGIY